MTTEERFERLEHYLVGVAEQHAKDFSELKGLWREIGERQSATDRQIGALTERIDGLTSKLEAIGDYQRETDRRLRTLGEATDERIAKLVSAIGQLIQQKNGSPSH